MINCLFLFFFLNTWCPKKNFDLTGSIGTAAFVEGGTICIVSALE